MISRPARRQQGAALLALAVVIMLGGLWFLLAVVQPANRIAVERAHNAKVLNEAKRALIDYVAAQAITSGETYPGRLPCPEGAAWVSVANADGIAAPGTQQGVANATCATIGRLPWRTLGIDKLQDAAGEPLWYMVSTGATGWALLNSSTTLSINSNKANNLSVDGNANQAIAAIVAPGAPLQLAPTANQIAAGCVARTQVRTPSAPNYLDYLECQTLAGPAIRTSVVENTTNPVFNDQVVIITAADILDAIEPSVAARIQRDVVPQLQAAYVNTSWGGSAAEPYFPFAVSYPSSGSFDAAASDFKGTLATAQGLLPMTADSTFVAWNTATVSAVKTGGTATTFTSNCATSTSTQITCTINFSVVLCVLCSVNADVQITATASNAGRAVRSLNAAAASGLTTFTAPLQSDGSATGTYVGTLNGGITFLGIPGLCGTLISALCSGSATVTIPISVFSDSFVNPATSDAWYWFVANKWHHVTFYGVSDANLPGGARNCTGAGNNCLNVTVDGGTSLTDKRAIVALAGRSVTGTSGSSRQLTDFLDTAVNVDFNSTFEQKRLSRSGVAGTHTGGAFNDRFVSVTP